MFELHQEFVRDYFEDAVIPQINSKSGEELLQEVVKQWNSYTIFAVLLNRLFDYINRNYLAQLGLRSLGHECQSEFKRKIAENLDDIIKNALQVQIQKERDGLEINRNVVKSLIQLYVDLGKEGSQKPVRKDGRFYWEGTPNLTYYEAQFEKPFLLRTKCHYRAKANWWEGELDLETFLRQVYSSIEREEENSNYWH